MILEDEVCLQYGILVITQMLIPMARVQNVSTKQGPLLRRYQLATVSISTAAGVHDIPALSLEQAKELRDKIIKLAGVQDDV
ncbi:PH domain-containing protein [Oceanobacillus sp. 143]|nr:PH domain-containing protein [Oceanobacillus sp. 143]